MDSAQLTLDTSRTYFLVCGIVNVLAAIFWSIMTFIGGMATCGFGCLLLIMPMIHITVMIFDFIAVSRLSSRPTPGVYSFVKLTAILDIVAGLAIVPLVLGILNLQLLARPEIFAYFHEDV